ncbi:MAG: homoserine dehydrogenase [Alphaproteobacteria bacterium]|nr:homoserine dehydrogenase [Alphaproteobacteria bacterium]
MTEPFRIALAGLGTVGTGVIKIVQQNQNLLARRAGRPIEIVSVSARDKNKDRGVDLSPYSWMDNAVQMADSNNVDAVVEMIGGSDGPALALTQTALGRGLHVVTANKAMLAHHGFELAKMAEDNKACLAYEAAVAGGIPIIKSMREGYAANEIQAVYGILNGTCNYILTEMRETGRDFADVLKDAQEKGYAEADPSFDVDGVDAGHKLCILSALAFGTKPDFASLKMTGIRQINKTDIAFAGELGYRIKLLGTARRVAAKVMQVLEPCLVPQSSPLGSVEGVYNAVMVEGDFVKTGISEGRGAGEGPTASAIVADIIDIARGFRVPTFGVPANDLKKADWADINDTVNSYYMRLTVLDQPGVIADVSAILRDHRISIEGFIQRGRDPGQPVPVVITTHETRHGDVLAACDAIEKLEFSVEKPCLMRVENIG